MSEKLCLILLEQGVLFQRLDQVVAAVASHRSHDVLGNCSHSSTVPALMWDSEENKSIGSLSDARICIVIFCAHQGLANYEPLVNDVRMRGAY
jgi:hypothetical protein